MKKLFILALMIIIGFNGLAQIIFEPGYYIDNAGKKVEGLIKNAEWKKNPEDIIFKKTATAAEQKLTIDTVQSFTIGSSVKYVRANVDIDRSSNNVNNLGTNRNPVFQKEQLFLKVLLDGKADLLEYQEGSLIRFFFRLDENTIEQLIFKNYIKADREIGINVTYKSQIFSNLKCNDITLASLNYVTYTAKSLLKIFIRYNKCSNSPYGIFKPEKKSNKFSLTLNAGVDNASVKVENFKTSIYTTSFEKKVTYRVGLMASYYLPFNKNKWAIAVEPSYRYFNSANKYYNINAGGDGILISNINYKSLDILLGLRYTIFLGPRSNIFIMGGSIFSESFNSKIQFKRTNEELIKTLEIVTSADLYFSFGYSFANKLTFQIRMMTKRDLLVNYITNDKSTYQGASLLIGYTLFK